MAEPESRQSDYIGGNRHSLESGLLVDRRSFRATHQMVT